MKKRYLESGKIVSTHGIKGELRIQPWCDTPDFLCEFGTVYLDAKGDIAHKVEQARVHGGMVLLKLSGIETLDAALALRGKLIYIDRNDAPEDELYFIQDLIGLRVLDADTKQEWGKLTDVQSTGANDVYTVTDVDSTLRLFPAIPEVVLEVNLDEGYMLIRPLEGLFDAD